MISRHLVYYLFGLWLLEAQYSHQNRIKNTEYKYENNLRNSEGVSRGGGHEKVGKSYKCF